MALEIEGTITRKLDVQSGVSQRGAWSKQEFIVEYQEGNFPTQICFNVWGEDKVKDLDRFKIGDHVKVSFNLSSREYNGRWYTDVRAWRIEPVTGQSQPAAQTPAAPAAAAPVQSVPETPAAAADGETDDDLPF